MWCELQSCGAPTKRQRTSSKIISKWEHLLKNLNIRKHQNENIYFTYFPPISSKCNKEDAVKLEFKMRPSADLWEKWRILSNMRKPKNNIFSELYFDQYEVDVNAKNIRYFEEEAQPFIKVISCMVSTHFLVQEYICLCYPTNLNPISSLTSL